MQIVMTLLCRNEEDIIAENIEFHLRQGVDFIIATDNTSSDRTTDILKTYQDQGVLRLMYAQETTHDQAVWVTRMARIAARDHQADWVINSDADEFWWPSAGDLKTTFQDIPEDIHALEIQRNNFLPNRQTIGSGRKFFDTMRIRETASCSIHGKRLPPKVCHRPDPDITVSDGNHRVTFSDGTSHAVPNSDLEILHYPVRTFLQLENKIRLGTQALERNQRLNRNIGNTWRHLYHEYYQTGRLEEYFEGLMVENEALARDLLSGHLIEDSRLSDYFEYTVP